MCHSHIAGVDTTVAPELDEARSGVRSLLTTGQTKSGGTAGEENDVRLVTIVYLLLSDNHNYTTGAGCSKVG